MLVQALLDAPLFGVRWRWNATTALALPRFRGGQKVAPQLQRMKSQDLLAAVFPDQVACAENLTGAREIPDHPLVAQTLHDCLDDAMDATGWLQLLRGIEAGDDRGRLPRPAGAVAARRRGAEARGRMRTSTTRRSRSAARRRCRTGATPIRTAPTTLGRLDPDAIDSVRQEAWPRVRSADEMHEALHALGVVSDGEAAATEGWLLRARSSWRRAARATRLMRLDAAGPAPACGSRPNGCRSCACSIPTR